MARSTAAVQHFVACAAIEPMRDGYESPYRLSGVSYAYGLPPRNEWPVRLDELWLFVRFYDGSGTRYFDIDVIWLDGPNGEQEICTFPGYQVQFGRGHAVASRAFPVAAVRYPGSGRYRFSLRPSGQKRVLKTEHILIRRLP